MSLLKRVEPDRADSERRPRLWTIPPPPPFCLDPFEGAGILEEVPNQFAGVLWQRLRDVLLWSAVAPLDRSGLFASTTDRWTEVAVPEPGAEDLTPALDTLHSLVRAPGLASPSGIATACAQVSTWAEISGFPTTDRLFSEAAAAVLPVEPAYALAAGRAARRSAAYERALEWFRRALALARRSEDVQAYTLAHLNRGNLELQRGNLHAAMQFFTHAWRAAKRFKLRRLGAFARHDLLVLGYEKFSLEEAQAHAEGALALYGPRHERIPYLAHDTAFLWMHHGYFSTALPVFQQVLPLIASPNERFQVLAHIARCAAVLGDSGLATASTDAALRALRPSYANAAAALLYVARAAATLGNRRFAQEIGTRAFELARTRGEKSAERLATAFLAALRKRGGAVEVDTPAPEIVLVFRERVQRRLLNVAPPP